jgi:ABC-type nitrate/sulfonate/bicarbonate transport system substrate-binding protein
MGKKTGYLLVLVVAVLACAAYAVTLFPAQPVQFPGIPESITIGTTPNELSTLIWIAQERGFFSRNGLNVTVKTYDTGLSSVNGKVFYNLIDNALRYGGAGLKTVQVSSRQVETALVIICQDDGVGISVDDKKNLFTRGFGKNTGLGLFLSREIIGITGITIMENGEPGQGARFEITVPKGMWRIMGANE